MQSAIFKPLWNTEAWQKNQLSVSTSENAETAGWRPDGETFMVSSGEGTQIYNTGFEVIASLEGMSAATYSPDGTIIGAIGISDQFLYLYDATSYTEIAHFEQPIHLFSFNLDSNSVAAVQADTWNNIYFYDLKSHQLTSTLETEDSIWSIAFSRDGQYLASSSATHLRIIDTQTTEDVEHISLEPSFGLHPAIAWSPDSRQIAVISGQNRLQILSIDHPENVTFLDIANPATNIAEDEQTYLLAWNPDGKQLASASRVLTYSSYPNDNSVHLWDTETDELTLVLQAEHVNLLSWNPAGTILATASLQLGSETPENQYTLRLWNSDTGAILYRTSLPLDIAAVEWSLDGRYLLAVTADKSLYLWETVDGSIRLIKNQ